jgi:hypothetical protein
MKIKQFFTPLVIGSALLGLITIPVEAREVLLRQSQNYRYDNYPSRNDDYYNNNNAYDRDNYCNNGNNYCNNSNYNHRRNRNTITVPSNSNVYPYSVHSGIRNRDCRVDSYNYRRHYRNQGSYIYYDSSNGVQIRVGY